MGRQALLVIDVQRGLCEGPDAAFASARVIEHINQLSQRARERGVPVVFVQHEGRDGYLEHGSADWQLPDKLVCLESDLRVRKTTPDAFHGTPLAALLQAQGVTALVVCGMHTEFCVDTTTRRAMALGFPVTLVSDAHTTAGNAHLTPQQVIDHHNATLSNISSFGPRTIAVATADVRFGE